MPRTRTQPRQCLWVDETMVDPDRKDHFIPALVVENEAGYSPLRGDAEKFQAPWSWGPGIEAARAAVTEYNTQLGLSQDDAFEIVASSMRASR